MKKKIAEVDGFDVGALYYDKEMPLDSLTVYGEDWVMPAEYGPNTPIILRGNNAQGDPGSALGVVKKDKIVLVEDRRGFCGIQPKNVGQVFALNMLADIDTDLVIITGRAGSGKTLLALAYAMNSVQCHDVGRVILTKPLTPIGREIGYLKGDYMDKVRPWLGNFYDNMRVLGIDDVKVDSMVEANLEDQKTGAPVIEISPITFMQGRSIQNAIMIIDEAQNLDKNVIKQILTRPAEKTKVIMIGDLDQVFEKGVSSDENGLIWAINNGEKEEFISHIHLEKVERSRLSEWASKLS